MLPTTLFDGVEVDVISIGDADCIVVTQWHDSIPHRILIDGGCGGDAQGVKDFLLYRGYTYFWAVLCTHLHNDHATGLIKIVQDKSFTFSNGWMHDITKHVSAETLRRAAAAVDGVKDVVETTRELAAAFASRKITPMEPFAGMAIAAWPAMTVLGPSLPFYREVIQNFAKVELPAPVPRPIAPSPLWTALALSVGADTATPLYGLGRLAASQPPRYNSLASLIPSISLPTLTNALRKSSVSRNPTTQPFNNTSAVLGVTSNGAKLLLTADAGSEALSHVGAEWNHLNYLGVPHHGSDGNLSQGDIERFCPQFAFISSKGDSSHPSRAVVSGLVKIGAKVASTHKSGHLHYSAGRVPPRPDYKPAEFLRGTGEPEPVVADWAKLLSGLK